MAQFNSYPTKATPIAADTVLIYDSAGAVLKQVPIKNLFENYAGTSLGGSAQTVKSAIDALNSKIMFKSIASEASITITAEHLMIIGKRNNTNANNYSVYIGSKTTSGFVVCKLYENNDAILNITYNDGTVTIQNTMSNYAHIMIVVFLP